MFYETNFSQKEVDLAFSELERIVSLGGWDEEAKGKIWHAYIEDMRKKGFSDSPEHRRLTKLCCVYSSINGLKMSDEFTGLAIECLETYMMLYPSSEKYLRAKAKALKGEDRRAA